MNSIHLALSGWACLILGTIHGYNHSPVLSAVMLGLSAVSFLLDVFRRDD